MIPWLNHDSACFWTQHICDASMSCYACCEYRIEFGSFRYVLRASTTHLARRYLC